VRERSPTPGMEGLPRRTRGPRSPGLLGLVFKTLAFGAMIALPLLAVWIASSLAAYLNRRTWVPIAAGFALFPGLPLAWEGWANWRRARDPAARERKRFLTFGDRLVLRTLATTLLLLGVLLAAYPERAFVALASRGDWMLGSRRGKGRRRRHRVPRRSPVPRDLRIPARRHLERSALRRSAELRHARLRGGVQVTSQR
jgi:hypothetical protein